MRERHFIVNPVGFDPEELLESIQIMKCPANVPGSPFVQQPVEDLHCYG